MKRLTHRDSWQAGVDQQPAALCLPTESKTLYIGFQKVRVMVQLAS